MHGPTCVAWANLTPCSLQDGRTGRELAEQKGHAAVLARLRAVVAEQLRAAQVAGSAGAGDPDRQSVVTTDPATDRLAGKLVVSAGEGDGSAVGQLLAAGANPNARLAMVG
jgi:hypothetical protein